MSSLKYLYQVRKVSGHVFTCYGVPIFASFHDFSTGVWSCGFCLFKKNYYQEIIVT